MTNAFVFAAALLLLVSGVDHLRRGSPLQGALRAHAVLPARVIAPMRWLLPVAELAACAATFTLVPGVVAMTTSAGASGVGASGVAPSPEVTFGGRLVPVALVLAVLFAGFAGYAALAWRAARIRGTTVACGCGLGEAPLGGWTVARAVLVAVGALIAAGDGGGPIPASSTDVVVVGLAAFALAAALAIVPTARQLPARPTLAWSAAGARTSR